MPRLPRDFKRCDRYECHHSGLKMCQDLEHRIVDIGVLDNLYPSQATEWVNAICQELELPVAEVWFDGRVAPRSFWAQYIVSKQTIRMLPYHGTYLQYLLHELTHHYTVVKHDGYLGHSKLFRDSFAVVIDAAEKVRNSIGDSAA